MGFSLTKALSYTPAGLIYNTGKKLLSGDAAGAKKGIEDTANGIFGGGSGGAPAQNPADVQRRKDLEAQRDKDIAAARAYRDRLSGEPDAQPRTAPQATAPAPITTAHAASSFDTSQSDQSRAELAAYQQHLSDVAEGKAGASAAELAGRRLSESAIASQYALAAGGKGYSQSGLRAAGRNVAGIQQETIGQTEELRAREQTDARTQLGNSLVAGRGQDISQATAKGDQDLRASLANAGFDNQTMMHMSDQQLQVALANAGFHLTQEQIDDLRLKNQRDAQLAASGQVLGASSGAVSGENDRNLRQQQLQQMYDEAVRRGDAADAQMIATLLAKAAAA